MAGIKEEKKIYLVGIYCRLSKDDGTDNESASIATQKSILTDYVKKQGWHIAKTYVDDGYSGTNFQRPSFQNMIKDIESGLINCVITKDLSRLGRNYLDCGLYLEVFFPEHNVRYIAVNDGVDTLNKSAMDITPFRNILNEMFSLRMEALVIQYSPRIYNKSVSPVLSVRPQSAVLLSRFCQSAGEAFHGQGFPDCGTGG